MQFSVRGLIASTGILGAVSAIVVLNLTKWGAQHGESQDGVEVFFATVWAIVFFASFGGVALLRDGLVQLTVVLLGFVALVAGVVNIAVWLFSLR